MCARTSSRGTPIRPRRISVEQLSDEPWGRRRPRLCRLCRGLRPGDRSLPARACAGQRADAGDLPGGPPGGTRVPPVCAAGLVVVGRGTARSRPALAPGNERMQAISLAVQQGARAYLNRQYTTIAAAGVVLFVALIFVQNIAVAGGFAIGGLLSGATGYIGMNVSVRANARVAEAARGGVSPALQVAFRGGAITGLLVVGLALLGVAGYYGLLTAVFHDSSKTAVDALIGLGFGGSLISVFARLGGGVFP